jgi:hypothetical protein
VTEYAPPAITGLFDKIKAGVPSAIMAGVIGDSAHDYGYHRGRNYVSANDYSAQLAEDRAGDGEAACGLDLSWSDTASQYTVSQRLLNAKHDSRMYACREFYGSTDGRVVCGWDYAGGYAVTSDDSHLWHVHLSILRQYATDPAALDGIAQVITGGASTPTPDSEDEWLMSGSDDVVAAIQALQKTVGDLYNLTNTKLSGIQGQLTNEMTIIKEINQNTAATAANTED